MTRYRKQDLKALQETLISLDHPSCPASSPSTSLGLDALDQALPGGGLPGGALHEFVPRTYMDFPAALGFACSLLHHLTKARRLPVLWCSLGRGLDHPPLPFPAGFDALGLDPDQLLQVDVHNEKDMLWVLEEGLSSPACPVVIGAYTQREKLYDFTASRRLSLRAARHGGTLLLVRHYLADKPAGSRGTTAALTRWSISAHPSQPLSFSNARMPGFENPQWQVSLTRSKRGRPSDWQLEWDHETFSFRLATSLGNRTTLPETAPTYSEPVRLHAIR